MKDLPTREVANAAIEIIVVADKLNVLAELRGLRDASAAGLDAQIADLQAQRTALLADRDAQIASLEAEINAAVLPLGVSVKGDTLMAVWRKGRVTWDSRILEGYVLAHPELVPARHVGQPSVTIMPTRGGDAV